MADELRRATIPRNGVKNQVIDSELKRAPVGRPPRKDSQGSGAANGTVQAQNGSDEYHRRPHTVRRLKGPLFTNDLKALLYAFGDVDNPYIETVGVLEDILQEYIFLICQEASRMARASGRAKIKVEDFKFALRNDPRKLGRVEKLLVLQKEFDAARKEYDYSRLEGKNLTKMLD